MGSLNSKVEGTGQGQRSVLASRYQGGLEGLPTEIIYQSFSYLIALPPPGGSHFLRPSQDVKTLRLVSKRCNELASPFLVNSIRVFFTSESLLRLETFAKNPAISNGVKTVEINVSYYDNILATDRMSYAKHCASSWSLDLARSEHYGGRGVNYAWDDYAVREWYKVAEDDFVEDGCNERQDFLLKAFGEYCCRWEDQENLKADGKHVVRVAGALSRFSNLQLIGINDSAWNSGHTSFIYKRPKNSASNDTYGPFSGTKTLEHYCLKTLEWKQAYATSNLCPPPVEILPELFEAFRESLIRPPTIKISIDLPHSFGAIQLTESHRKAVRKNRSLRRFFNSSPRLLDLYHASE
ncbi:hypothetical protein B0O99DRAFT_693903 [Bisporella sp. PMI_857]|nr:hypothetical protein B0O99DRAFT_693903 [Bisporella sp. PMI_857]